MSKVRPPRLFYNRFFWQLILALFMLGMAFFFIHHEHVELIEIKNLFNQLNPFYVLLGVLLTVAYVFIQGEMYVYSFKTIGKEVPLISCAGLFLRRNLVSVFLPAGGFSSLAFFTKNIESKEITKSHIYLASTIYGIIGILSVVVIAIPILFFALLRDQLRTPEVLGFVFLVFLTILLTGILYSLLKKGWVFQLIQKKFPQYEIILNDFSAHQISRKHFGGTLMISLIIELVGIAHLYISMLALGFTPSLAAAMIGYVVMVILLIASPLLRGLGAIEVSITYILTQYGFPLVASASITLLFRLFEFWLPLFAGIGTFISKRDNLILRVLPALLLLILGITNIISAISPAIPARLHLVSGILPEGVISFSNGFILVSGLFLTLLAIFLLQGSKRAWYLAMVLSLLSVFGHLFKAIDYEESILSVIVVFVLIYTRSSYILKSHPYFTRLSLKVIFYGIASILLYGVLGFYFIDTKHFGVDFVLTDAIEAVLKLFFFLDDSSLKPLTPFALNFIHSIYGAGFIFIVFVIYGLLRPYFTKPFNSEEEISLVSNLVKIYGRSAIDYFKIYPGKLFFISADRRSFISFRITRHIAVILGDPIAPDEESMKSIVVRFDMYCSDNGFVPVYYRVPEKSLPIYQSLNKKSFPVGEEADLDLVTFTLDGGKMKTTRSAINRLTREGFVFKVYEPPIKDGLLQKIAMVSYQWLKDMGQNEISFTQGIFDITILKGQTVMTIEDQEEKVYAFLNLVPVYVPKYATYDLIRKVHDAPNGVLDMLLAKTFLYLKEQGYEKVNLGLAPLSGISGVDLKEKAVNYAYENLRTFGHFKGLRVYKEKFSPVWEKKYLVYDHSYHLLQVPAALRRVSDPDL